MPSQFHPTGADAALILDTAHEAFVAMGVDGSVREWNRAAETTFGWTREEAVGRELAELIVPPSLRDAHRAGLARFLATGQGVVLDRRLELPALHRDGHQLEVEITIAAPDSGDGTFFHAFLHDITARLRAERSLQAQLLVNEALATAPPDDVPRLVLEALGVAGGWTYAGWWLADDHHPYLYGYRAWNADGASLTQFEAASRRMEFAPGEGFVGRAWETGYAIWERDLASALVSERALAASECGLHGAVAVPLTSSSQVVGVLEFFADEPRDLRADIDELLRTMAPQVGEYLARTRAERSASDMKDRFVATVSHELRTPLTSIMGFAQTALDLDLGEERLREFLGIIVDQSQRLARLIEDLLSMSRIQAGAVQLRLAPIDIADVVRESLTQLGIDDVPVVINGAPTTAIADVDACRQLVTNLVDNAGRYGGGASSIELRVEETSIVMAVVDRGSGVPRAFRAHLFDRFSRASTSHEMPGTGLGLSIVLALAELQGGTAWYEPNEPTGSRFLVSMRRPSRTDPNRSGPADRR